MLTLSALGYQRKTISSDQFIPGEYLTIHLAPAVCRSEGAVVTAASFSSYRERNGRSLFNRAAKNIQSPPVEDVAFGFADKINSENSPARPPQFPFRIDTGGRLFSEYEEVTGSENNRGYFTYKLRFLKADSAGLPTESDLTGEGGSSCSLGTGCERGSQQDVQCEISIQI